MIKKISAIVWKDLITVLRTFKLLAVISIISAVCIDIFTIKDILFSNIGSNLKISFIRNNMLFLSAIIIPMVGSSIFQMSINEERSEKCLSVLFANKISSQIIWASKFITSIMVSYTLYIVAYILCNLIIRLYFNVTGVLNLTTCIYTLLIMPITCISMLSISGLLCWVRKDPGILMIIPTMGPMFLSMYLLSKGLKSINYMYIMAGFIGAIFLIVLISFVVNKISKEYITNL